jgi:flavin reductase (DIM6/NTAB) family NADH-FMN oxidoreductase RutF
VEFASPDLSAEAAYKLLIGSVVPRAIAWISTRAERGHGNVAPFSAFTFVSSAPPMIAVSIGRRDGRLKDTAINIAREGEFVVNIANMALIRALHQSSFAFGEHESEIAKLGLATAPSRQVGALRLTDAPVNLECKLHKSFELGTEPTQLFIGEVLYFHVRDELCVDGKIDSFALDPIARLGGPHYANLGRKITFGLGGSLEPSARI